MDTNSCVQTQSIAKYGICYVRHAVAARTNPKATKTKISHSLTGINITVAQIKERTNGGLFKGHSPENCVAPVSPVRWWNRRR